MVPTTVFISGNNFGAITNLFRLRVWYFLNETRVYSTASCLVVTNHTRIKCNTSKLILGHGRAKFKWQAEVQYLYSEVTNSSTRYKKPEIQSLQYHLDLDTRGGELVILRGLNFGPAVKHGVVPLYTTYMSASSGLVFQASLCNVTDNTEMRCFSAEGVGKGFSWKVEIESLSRNSLSTVTPHTVDPRLPALNVVQNGYTLNPNLAQKVNITGSNFGPIDN